MELNAARFKFQISEDSTTGLTPSAGDTSLTSRPTADQALVSVPGPGEAAESRALCTTWAAGVPAHSRACAALWLLELSEGLGGGGAVLEGVGACMSGRDACAYS